MRVKKKSAGGLISRIRNNRRIRKQRKLARENAGSTARSATSKLNSSSATPSKPKASVASGFVRQTVAPKMATSAPQRLKTRARHPNLYKAASTLRTMASRRPTLSRGSRNDEISRSMGNGRGILGMGERPAPRSRNEEMARSAGSLKGVRGMGEQARSKRRSVLDVVYNSTVGRKKKKR